MGRNTRLKRVIRSLLPTLLQAESVHLVVRRADINHSIRHGGRGTYRAAGGVAPLQTELPNIVDVKHLFTRVPALHVGAVELAPVVAAIARWLLPPCYGHEARTENKNQDSDSSHNEPPPHK